jgi:hypothetical protein
VFFPSRYNKVIFADGIRCRIIRDDYMVRESDISPDEKIQDLPDGVCRVAWTIEMVLVGNEDTRCLFEPGSKDTPIHGITDYAVKPVFTDELPDSQARSNHVSDNPFRAPQGLLQAEESLLPFEAYFPPCPVQTKAILLVQKFV